MNPPSNTVGEHMHERVTHDHIVCNIPCLHGVLCILMLSIALSNLEFINYDSL